MGSSKGGGGGGAGSGAGAPHPQALPSGGGNNALFLALMQFAGPLMAQAGQAGQAGQGDLRDRLMRQLSDDSAPQLGQSGSGFMGDLDNQMLFMQALAHPEWT